MLATATLIGRLRDACPRLGAVEGALELAAVLGTGVPVFHQPRAFVVQLGMRGAARASVAVGAFVQAIDLSFAVYLAFPAHSDPTARRVLPELEDVEKSVMSALCGWTPPDAGTAAAIHLVRGYLAELRPGLVVRAIEFTIADQLRIQT